jgi:hypothetical protein
MKTTVLSIQRADSQSNLTNEKSNGLKVIMLMGDQKQEFKFTVRKAKLGKREILTFVEEAAFSELFRFNAHIAIEINNLVAKVYQGASVKFPLDVGDFGTPEQALAEQKPFEAELVS